MVKGLPSLEYSKLEPNQIIFLSITNNEITNKKSYPTI